MLCDSRQYNCNFSILLINAHLIAKQDDPGPNPKEIFTIFIFGLKLKLCQQTKVQFLQNWSAVSQLN